MNNLYCVLRDDNPKPLYFPADSQAEAEQCVRELVAEGFLKRYTRPFEVLDKDQTRTSEEHLDN